MKYIQYAIWIAAILAILGLFITGDFTLTVVNRQPSQVCITLTSVFTWDAGVRTGLCIESNPDLERPIREVII